jgi:hypothetical protein
LFQIKIPIPELPSSRLSGTFAKCSCPPFHKVLSRLVDHASTPFASLNGCGKIDSTRCPGTTEGRFPIFSQGIHHFHHAWRKTFLWLTWRIWMMKRQGHGWGRVETIISKHLD